jgi:hypothetical protein
MIVRGDSVHRISSKCDVEGAEAEVFRGAGGLLGGKRPVIVCEMHSEENRRLVTRRILT